MLKQIIDHWPVYSIAAGGILSEILPFLPNKYNGIAQSIIAILKKK